jgi:hypothetical protein
MRESQRPAWGSASSEYRIPVDLQSSIVLADADPAGHVERDLAQVALVTHSID